MMNAYAVSWWRMAVVALWMVALPSGAEEVSSADVACAAARWAEGHPLFGPEVTVKSVDAMGEAPSMVYAVRFSSGAAAVFAGDTTQPPCRWFSTASAEEALETAARALAAAPVSGGTFSAEWDTLLAEDVPSERAARSLPEGTPLPGNAVGPLIRRNWSQEGHYNRMCPLRTSATYNHANDDRMYSGCVATAFAMYLDYYRWPFRGVGSTADSIESAWGASPDITACRTDFAVDFDFDALLDRYLLTASQRETMAVAQLMADSGAILEMDYGDDSSSSSFDNYAAVLSTHLLYNEWVSLANINTHPEKVPQVKAALAAGQPLLCNGIAGYDGNGEPMGHAYLCDGFCEVVIGDTTNT